MLGFAHMPQCEPSAASTIARFPWQSLLPGAVITMLVLAFSFLGDGLRDAFDPNTE